MTYVVELKEEYAFRILKELQKANALTTRKLGIEEKADTLKVFGSIRKGLKEVKFHQEQKKQLKTLDEFLDELYPNSP